METLEQRRPKRQEPPNSAEILDTLKRLRPLLRDLNHLLHGNPIEVLVDEARISPIRLAQEETVNSNDDLQKWLEQAFSRLLGKPTELTRFVLHRVAYQLFLRGGFSLGDEWEGWLMYFEDQAQGIVFAHNWDENATLSLRFPVKSLTARRGPVKKSQDLDDSKGLARQLEKLKRLYAEERPVEVWNHYHLLCLVYPGFPPTEGQKLLATPVWALVLIWSLTGKHPSGWCEYALRHDRSLGFRHGHVCLHDRWEIEFFRFDDIPKVACRVTHPSREPYYVFAAAGEDTADDEALVPKELDSKLESLKVELSQGTNMGKVLAIVVDSLMPSAALAEAEVQHDDPALGAWIEDLCRKLMGEGKLNHWELRRVPSRGLVRVGLAYGGSACGLTFFESISKGLAIMILPNDSRMQWRWFSVESSNPMAATMRPTAPTKARPTVPDWLTQELVAIKRDLRDLMANSRRACFRFLRALLACLSIPVLGRRVHIKPREALDPFIEDLSDPAAAHPRVHWRQIPSTDFAYGSVGCSSNSMAGVFLFEEIQKGVLYVAKADGDYDCRIVQPERAFSWENEKHFAKDETDRWWGVDV